MKLATFSFALLAVSSVLAGTATTAQESKSELTPEAVSITTKSEPLRPGQSFSFLVTLDREPHDYEGAAISAAFQRAGPTPRIKSRFQDDPNFLSATATVHDGQRIYLISLYLQPWTAPGKWRLKQISVSRRGPGKTFPVSEDVSFEVPDLLPMSLKLDVPKSVEAGHLFIATATLDKYPQGVQETCIMHLTLRANRLGENSLSDWADVTLVPNQISYKFSYPVDPEFQTGSYEGEIGIYARFGERDECLYPALANSIHFSFAITPDRGLVKPTAVAVTVNPSQAQLLVAAADRLEAKAKHLTEQIGSTASTTNRTLLQNAVRDALKDLDDTQASFLQAGRIQTGDPSSRDVLVFFDDIRRSYAAALTVTNNLSENLVARLVWVQDKPESTKTFKWSDVLEAVLESFHRNVTAYQIVASTEVITFSLNVKSKPEGADIYFRRWGEDYEKEKAGRTNSPVENLPRAFYYFLLRKDGCTDDSETVDAMRVTKPDVDVVLDCKGGKK